ncbi:hypothetical protein J6590_083711 [Homalodisca vitripennis]|nr:hypothetical protein J6590_083711 [Homalodisca vitripennis]
MSSDNFAGGVVTFSRFSLVSLVLTRHLLLLQVMYAPRQILKPRQGIILKFNVVTISTTKQLTWTPTKTRL